MSTEDWTYTIEKGSLGYYWTLSRPTTNRIGTCFEGISFTRRGAFKKMRKIKKQETGRVINTERGVL